MTSDDGKRQQLLLDEVTREAASRDRLFLEFVTSSTPLTKEEIRKLIKKRPELWGRYAAWA